MTHICIGKLIIIDSDNGLSPEWRQAISWTNAGILLIGPLGTNFSEILIEIQTFSLKKMRLKMSSAKCCSFCLGLNVLTCGDRVKARHMAKTPYYAYWMWLLQGAISIVLMYILKPGPSQYKIVFLRYRDSHVTDKMVGETVLSLTWESLYW